MIPKKIHYCWFGGNKKPEIILACLDSWKKYCKDYEIIEWNEENIPISEHPFTAFAYSQKKWAFVSDYVRFSVLFKEGGIYLDTDMLLCKPLDNLLSNSFFTAYEEGGYLSCGALGCTPGDTLVKKCLNYYDTHPDSFTPVPKILTQEYESLSLTEKKNITIYPQVYFYPFNQVEISAFTGKNAPNESYGVHLWNYSWGHPFLRYLNKKKQYHTLKKGIEKLGLKRVIKKMLRMH